MSQITQVMPQMPTPPTKTDPVNFDARADATVVAQAALSGAINVWSGQANTLAGELNQANADAQAAKNATQAAQAAAEAVASATEWTGGTVTAGECRYGSDGQTYRCLVANADVNPVGDTTGSWVRISAGGSALLTTADFEAAVGHRYMIAPGVECTLPAAPSVGDQVEVRAAGSRDAVTASPPVLLRNGGRLFGDEEDKYLNGLGSVVLTWAGSSYGGWV